MSTENVVQVKSYDFAVRIVKLHQHLIRTKQERVLSAQLLRAGTSVGANIEEAIGGQSRADFASKLSIAYKEARETNYWLRLLKDTAYLSEAEFSSIYPDSEELCRIIAAILKTTKSATPDNS